MSRLNLSDIGAMANGRLHGSARPVERIRMKGHEKEQPAGASRRPFDAAASLSGTAPP